MCKLTTCIYWIYVPVCNLLGNIYNKAYRNILGNIMMSNDGGICFIVVPDKNIMENITSVISSQPFWISCFTKHPQGWELHIRPDITIGEPAKHNQNRKKTISKNNVSRSSLRCPVVFAHICINIDFTIFFSKNKWKNWLSHTWKHKNRHIIYVSSVCSCKIIRKYVYFYILWRPSWISPF